MVKTKQSENKSKDNSFLFFTNTAIKQPTTNIGNLAVAKLTFSKYDGIKEAISTLNTSTVQTRAMQIWIRFFVYLFIMQYISG